MLASDLHLVYLVTPTNVDVQPDWELYYERFMQLPPLEQVKFYFNFKYFSKSWVNFSLSYHEL